MHERNSYITLTYDEEHKLPGGICILEASNWIKRLREHLDRKYSIKIRHYTVGEYGGRNSRAHFHSCVFGWYPSPDDLYEIGDRKYASHLIDETWARGRTSIDELNAASAAYVARYCLKKITGDLATNWYLDEETGDISPERAIMSRRPGIGRSWYEKHSEEVFPSDKIYFSGGLVTPPKYYFNILKQVNPSLAEEVAATRAGGFDLAEWDRLVPTGVAEEVYRSRLSTEKRHKEI